MGALAGITVAPGLALYAWLWYRCMLVAAEKQFSAAATITSGILTTPLVAFLVVTFLPDPLPSRDRRLSAHELTAVLEARGARMEAARAEKSSI